MLVNTTPKGPFAFNKETSDFIKFNGKNLDKEIPKEVDPKYDMGSIKYGINLWVLHIPTNRVCAYNIYYDFSIKMLRTFNGWFDEPLDNENSEFKWIYERDFKPTTQFTDNE